MISIVSFYIYTKFQKPQYLWARRDFKSPKTASFFDFLPFFILEGDFDMDFRVVDMLPGSGKTTLMTKFLGKRKKRFIYVTPYKDGLENIGMNVAKNNLSDKQQKGIEIGLYEPDELYGKLPDVPDGTFSKTSDLLHIMRKGNNVVCTHQLFWLVVKQKIFWELVKKYGYELVIDEEITLYRDYKFCLEDIEAFLLCSIDGNEPILKVDETGKLSWNTKDTRYSKGYFAPIKKEAKSDTLYLNGKKLRTKLPLDKFGAFSTVYLLTFRYEFSVFRVQWDKVWPDNPATYWHFEGNELVEGKYQLSVERAEEIKQRLVICTKAKNYPQKVGKKGHYSYSREWYREATDKDFDEIVQSIQLYVKRRATGSKARLDKNKIIWTTFKEYKDKIVAADKGVNHFLKKDVDNFLPLNMRATNDYLDKNVVIFLVDRHIGAVEEGISGNEWALSELLQFIFRTSLRLEGIEEKCYVWVPSDRMRGLLVDWLKGLGA